MIVAYGLFFSAVSLREHAAYQTTAFDLGNMDQAVWNSLYGRPLAYTNWDTEGTRLGYHVDPILILLSPFYLLHNGAGTLLILQSFALALGALPIYALARRAFRAASGRQRDRSWRVAEWPALVFAAAYLLFPALQAANLFDFHPTTLEAPLIAFALYFVESRRHRALFVTALLIMACKEDATLAVVALGLYTVLRAAWHRRSDPSLPARPAILAGLALIVTGIVWFVVAVYVIIPHFNLGGKSPYLGAYRELGRGPVDILRTLLTDPAKVMAVVLIPPKLIYLRDLFTPVLFTSLLAPLALVPALPTLALNLLSHNVPLYTLEKFHYAAPLAPTVVVSGAYGTVALLRLLRNRFPGLPADRAAYGLSFIVLAASLLYQRGHGFTPLGTRFNWPEITPRAELADEFVRLIPPGVPVSAQSRLNPHLSNRPLIYLFPKIAEAEYVLFDVTADTWPVHPNDVRRVFDELIAGDYGVRAAQNGFVLLKRGEQNKALPDRFYDFLLADDPSWPVEAGFGDRLRLRGFDLETDEKGRAMLATYWQAQPALSGEDLRIYPFYYDEATGEIIEDTEQRPLVGLLWYPTSRWRPTETIRLTTLPWEVGPEAMVAVGVLAGRDWWHDRRLPTEVLTGTAVVRPVFDGTALQLAQLRENRPRVEERLFTLPATPQHVAEVGFGDVATLLGYDINCPACEGLVVSNPSGLTVGRPADGDTSLTLTLFWRARARTDQSYTVFTHLIGPDGRLVSQQDNPPRDGTRPTDTWLAGELLVDPYRLAIPAGLAAGIYRIEVGLYDAVSGEHLPAFDAGGTRLPDDRLLLPVTVELRNP